MDEFRLITYCLQRPFEGWPTREALDKSAAEWLAEAQREFDAFCRVLPGGLREEAADRVGNLCARQSTEAFARGLRAGARLTVRLLKEDA